MTVTSSTDIANLSLDLLNAGIVNNIENPTTATESMLARWYDQSRRKVLREHPWNFASKTIILSASATRNAFNETVYPVPNDFIRLCSLVGAEGQTLSKEDYRFEQGAIVISADGGQVKAKYIFDVKDVLLFDPLFIDVLTYEIAINIAYKVSNNNSNVQKLVELYKMRSALARAIDGQESPPRRREVSLNLSTRRLLGTRTSNRIIF